MPARVVRIAFLGFGTVHRALHALLARRRDALVREHGVECIVTGVTSRRLGWRVDFKDLQ
jgi:homoserine dehydrogenase